MYGEIDAGAEAASLVQNARVIHKFSIPIDGDWHRQNLPQGANLIFVGNNDSGARGSYPKRFLQFWAEVPSVPAYAVPREFRVFGTGDPILEYSAQWVGSFVDTDTHLVWHMYMRPGA